MVQGRHRRAIAASAVLVCAVGGAIAVVFAVRGSQSRNAPPAATRAARRSRRRLKGHATVRIVSGRHDRPVPILMYHVIGTPTATAPFPELFVRPTVFTQQMRWLARHGYHAVTLRRLYDYWRKGYALPHRPIVLSFDDGYLGDDTHARPILAAHHWPGVLNLEVNNLRTVGDLPAWRVRRLIASGWEIDAHTITHPDLTTVDAGRLHREVAGSRLIIRRDFGLPVAFFCYPSGRYDARVVAAVRRAGYLGATTTNEGFARPSDLYTLSRIRVNGSDGVRGLAEKLGAVSRAPGSG
jgi:peptidoglycan/xylan/chitin deacetylase (PgdA/CDA1 family)